MIVIVAGELFQGKSELLLKLSELLINVVKYQHTLLVDPPDALEQWLEKRDEETRDAFRAKLGDSVRAASELPADAATIRIEATASPVWADPEAVLPLDDALAVLAEPLGVLLENAKADWNFLRGIMSRSERERLLDAEKRGRVTQIHGAGDTLKDELLRRIQTPSKRLRTFVLFDSDRLHPDEFDASWTIKRPGKPGAACNAFEWEKLTRTHMPRRYWMLRRRFIESYMPRDELKSVATEDRVMAFFAMNEPQRWYYNMKEGFGGDSRRHDKDRSGALYDGVDRSGPLSSGFGQDLATRYAEAINRDFDWDAEAQAEAQPAIERLMRLL